DATEQPAPITFRLAPAVLPEARPAFPGNVPPGDYVVLEVADSGCGMAPEVLAQAFDPFFTTKEVGHGTGLGLPLVLRIVEAHHGFLNRESAPGRGTCVSLYLPRWQEPARPAAEEPPFAPGQVLDPEPLPGRHILVVDDEEAVRDVVSRFLEIEGHRVTSVGSGPAAVAPL